LPDPDPDRYKFQANDKVDKLNFFSKNSNICCPKTENYDTDTDEKDKTSLTGKNF
jgi:hypothetical protein